jgi:hypothetical protein
LAQYDPAAAQAMQEHIGKLWVAESNRLEIAKYEGNLLKEAGAADIQITNGAAKVTINGQNVDLASIQNPELKQLLLDKVQQKTANDFLDIARIFGSYLPEGTYQVGGVLTAGLVLGGSGGFGFLISNTKERGLEVVGAYDFAAVGVVPIAGIEAGIQVVFHPGKTIDDLKGGSAIIGTQWAVLKHTSAFTGLNIPLDSSPHLSPVMMADLTFGRKVELPSFIPSVVLMYTDVMTSKEYEETYHWNERNGSGL